MTEEFESYERSRLTGKVESILYNMKRGCTCKIGAKKGRALQLIYCYILHNYAIPQVMPLICHSASSFLLLPSPVGVGVSVFSIQKVSRARTYDTRPQQKNNRLLHIFIFILFYYFFWRLLKKKLQNLFSHPYFIIRILSSVFYHPHFIIRIFPSAYSICILLSAFCRQHFVIRILLSAIRRPPSAAIRSSFTDTHKFSYS